MQNDKQLAMTNTKPLTPELVKLFEKRWEKTINLHSDESRTTQSYGRSVNVISVKERMTNKKYKVVLNYHHQHNRHVGKCECGMWQEMYFPCKHAMMIIKQRCNNDKINAMNHIIEKKYCDIIFQNQHYIQMFNVMFPDNYIVPDIEKIANFKREYDGTVKVPKCESTIANNDGTFRKCSCGFHDKKFKEKKRGRKITRRLFQRAKGPGHC